MLPERTQQLTRVAAGDRGESSRGRGRGAPKSPPESGRGRGPVGRGKKRARSDTPDPRSKSTDAVHSSKPSNVEVPAGSPDSKKPALGDASAASPSPRAARSRSRAAAAQAAETATGASQFASQEVGSGADLLQLRQLQVYQLCGGLKVPVAVSDLLFWLAQSMRECLS